MSSNQSNLMIKKLLIACSMFALATDATAQYYYKDLVSNKILLDEMQKYKEEKVRTVNIKSFENDGSPSEDFFCQRKINKSYTKVEMLTKSNITGASVFTSYFTKEGALLRTVDSSDLAVATSTYEYDAAGRIASIKSFAHSSDSDFVNTMQEVHTYEYDTNGKPTKLLRTKTSGEVNTILFSTDESGNVTIEKDTKTGKAYYYYYDTKKRLTDVVVLQERSQKLLPDYIFEYNNNGQIAQMTTTEEGGNNYFIWRYNYDNGLRIREKCFDKARNLLGTIEYEYK